MKMHHWLRKVTALGFWGCILMGFGPHGCSNRLGPVYATQRAGGRDSPNLADIFIKDAKECMETYGRQLEPGRTVLESTVAVNDDGDKLAVAIAGIPETAPDFGACMRNALRDMPIAEQPFRESVDILKFHLAHAKDSEWALRHFIEAIPGVPIVESELVLEVEGYTVVLPVSVMVRAELEELVGIDEAALKKLGQMAIDSLGYDEIMTRAEQLGWVKKVPIKQAQSAAAKGLMGDGPLPPNVEQIIKESFKMVMTKAAPTALLVSQVDSPAPGPADLVAVGIFGVGLVATGVVSVYIYVSNKNAESATTSGSAPAPQPPPPPPPPPPPRKYPNQTCTNEEMARLEDEMHKICDEGFAATCGGGGISKKKVKDIPCSLVKLSILQRKACLAARWKVQNECFDGKPDDKHKKPIDDHQRGLDYCEALKLDNCAKGHPMANL